MNIPESIHNYITQYLLKNGEVIQYVFPSEHVEDTYSAFKELHIIRRTTRTYRFTGKLILTMDNEFVGEGNMRNYDTDSPDPPSFLQQWSPAKRAILEESEAFDLLQQGWIIKEIRLKKDGKTIERTHYRMGHRLFRYLEDQESFQQEQQMAELDCYRKAALICEEPEIRDTEVQYSNMSEQHRYERRACLEGLVRLIDESLNWNVPTLVYIDFYPKRWDFKKRLGFLYFNLAFIQISLNAKVFDWKEIGARYYGEIGGSKAFDSHRDEYISLLEQIAGMSVELLGMISTGKITPMYFAGDLDGQWSTYKTGPVHALTDLSIAQDRYSTEATTLWLVENRAILTRMAAEPEFLEQTGSLIVCVDGHLRISHRMFIQRLLQEKRNLITQAILWSDYDRDGLYIIGEMANAISEYGLHLKLISHNHHVYTDLATFTEYMESLLTSSNLEQEQVLGSKKEWIEWIKH